MTVQILSIVENAFRATLEEQDDAALWLSSAIRKEGTEVDILLKKNAVHYALANPGSPTLDFGTTKVEHPARFDQDIERLIKNGARVYVLQDDVAALGLQQETLVEGVATITASELPFVSAKYDHVWWW